MKVIANGFEKLLCFRFIGIFTIKSKINLLPVRTQCDILTMA